MIKTTYKRAELQEFKTTEELKRIDKALCAAAYKMRDNARRILTNNDYGYRMHRMQEGIMLGALKTGVRGVSSITLHALGNGNKPNTWKVRLFAGGTIHRQHRKGKQVGYIKSIDPISKALDARILDSYLDKVLK